MPANTHSIVTVKNRQLKLTNLDKVLYPQVPFTKAQVLDYYAHVSSAILPYLKNRPLTLKRYPNGVASSHFYERMCPSHRPSWMPTVRIASESAGRNVDYCMVNDAAALIWVANLASIELHTLLATVRRLDRPTFIVFDLDPGAGATIHHCAQAAIQLRDLLEREGLRTFAKTSGSKGVHVYLPLNTPVAYEQTKTFARSAAMEIERSNPSRITTNMRRDTRKGKVFIDWSQNDAHKTTVTAYSLRALERPYVSAPISWNELEALGKGRSARSVNFDSAQVLSRLDSMGDLFQPVLQVRQRI